MAHISIRIQQMAKVNVTSNCATYSYIQQPLSGMIKFAENTHKCYTKFIIAATAIIHRMEAIATAILIFMFMCSKSKLIELWYRIRLYILFYLNSIQMLHDDLWCSSTFYVLTRVFEKHLANNCICQFLIKYAFSSTWNEQSMHMILKTMIK